MIETTDILSEKKEKWTNKGTDKQYVADFLLYKVQLIITKLCTKFQDPQS